MKSAIRAELQRVPLAPLGLFLNAHAVGVHSLLTVCLQVQVLNDSPSNPQVLRCRICSLSDTKGKPTYVE